MKRILPYSLVLASAVVAFACSSKSDDKSAKQDTTDPVPDTTDPGTAPDAGPATPPGPKPGSEDPSGNPILLGPPRTVRSFTPPGGEPEFLDGPQWIAAKEMLYVSLPLATNVAGGKGILTRFKSDGTNYTEVRAGDKVATGVVGNSVDKNGNLISAELKTITRTDLNGIITVLASGYTADGLVDPEGGTVTPFDGPNDLVALDDGTIFVTDPGYTVEPRPAVGHLFKIAPGAAAATLAAAYDYNPSPNGIALSKDQTTLYVGFTAPGEGTLPFIRKYTINADRTLTDNGKFLETPLDSSPDGLAVDSNDNLYVGLKGGIAVYKSTGEPYGGAAAKIPQTKIDSDVTAITFGGADQKSLFVTIKGGKVFELKVKVPGIVQ